MRQFEKPSDQNRYESLRASLMMLCFGFGVLAFLIVIGRSEWFHLRPASGTAAAMANAGTHAGSNTTQLPGEDGTEIR